MVFKYDDSISFLKSTLEEKARINTSYSLRAFAKKLGLSPGGLSLVLNRKKRLSLERAYEIAGALELNAEETEYFLALIQMEGAKSEALKLQYLDRVKELNPHISGSQNLKKTLLGLEHFKLISDWYGLAILELISGVKGKWDAKSISKKLKLTKIEVEVMLERLVKLEIIKEVDGSFKRNVDTLMIESHVPSEALRSYYEGVHEQSLKTIRTQGPAEKVIGAQVFAFDPSQMEEVRELTNNFLDQLNDLALKGKNKTEVYQAITNIFKISHQENV